MINLRPLPAVKATWLLLEITRLIVKRLTLPAACEKTTENTPPNSEISANSLSICFSCPEGQANFTDFLNRFGQIMPASFPSLSNDTKAQSKAKKASSLANPPFWYSFEYGMVHIVMFDTEVSALKGGRNAFGLRLHAYATWHLCESCTNSSTHRC